MGYRLISCGAAALALLAVAAAPAAANTYKLTYTGYMGAYNPENVGLTGLAIDTDGLFGTAGADLAGASFSLSYTYTYNAAYDHVDLHSDIFSSRGPGAFDSVVTTINGITYSYGLSAIDQEILYGRDTFRSADLNAGDDSISAHVFYHDSQNIVPSLFVTQSNFAPSFSSLAGIPPSNGAQFTFTVGNDAMIGLITAWSQGPANPVPEPGSLAIFAGALAAAGFCLRRRA